MNPFLEKTLLLGAVRRRFHATKLNKAADFAGWGNYTGEADSGRTWHVTS